MVDKKITSFRTGSSLGVNPTSPRKVRARLENGEKPAMVFLESALRSSSSRTFSRKNDLDLGRQLR